MLSCLIEADSVSYGSPWTQEDSNEATGSYVAGAPLIGRLRGSRRLAGALSAITAAVTLPLIPIFMILIGKLTEGRTERRLRGLHVLTGQMLDLVEGLPTLRAFDLERWALARMRRTSWGAVEAEMDRVPWFIRLMGIGQVAFAAWVLLTLGVGVGVSIHTRRLLGPLERVLILGLGLAGQVTAASLVIAAKGLIRFPELQSSSRADDDGAAPDRPRGR
mgnify:CR=1 FL=1